MRRSLLAAIALGVLAAVGAASPAAAQRDRRHGDRRISVSGDVVVAEGEVVDGVVVSIDGSARIDGVVTDDVLVGDGNLQISGRVTGDVLVVHGDIGITGRVRGDVVALTGQVTVKRGASVGGDVVSRRRPRVASGTVRGDVKRVNLANLFTGFIIAFLVVLWIAVTVSFAVLGLLFVVLFPRAADVAAAAGKRVGASFGWGALVGIVGPIVAVLVLVTIVGIPLGLGMLSALGVLGPLGYVVTALVVGRFWVKSRTTGGRIGAFFAGFGVLRAAALIPGVGLVVGFLASVYGLGALAIAAWYGGRGPGPPGGDESAVLETPSSEPPREPAERGEREREPAPAAPVPDDTAPGEDSSADELPPVNWTSSPDG